MTIFADSAPRYWAAGLQAIPLVPKEKRPSILDWSRFSAEPVSPRLQEEWLVQYPTSNIGLVLGPASGVTVIDIDTEDKSLIEKIIEAIPHSPWKRRGKKGMMLAYKFSGLKTFRVKNSSGETIVECLSSRTQCVLPPSIHPDTGKEYQSNCHLFNVLDQLKPLPDNIEEILRALISAHGVTLSHSGWSKVTEFVSSGSRDTTLTELAGLFAFAVVRGERTLKEAVGMLRSYHGEFIENSAGDIMDVEKHVSNLVRFLHRDVLEKGKVLPKGWEAGLNKEDLAALGCTLNEEHTEWSFQEVLDYLQDQFEKHPQGQERADCVQNILKRLARSPSINRVDEDRILKYIVDVSSLGVGMSTYRARLKELRQGDVVGNDHSEIANAAIKDLEQYNMVRYVNEKFMKWGGSHWIDLPVSEIQNLVSDNYGHLPACKKHNDMTGIVKVMSFLCQNEIKKIPIRGVNFANGFLTTEMKLIPHNPDFGMTYTLPFRYMADQAGRFPRFNKFLDRSWGRDEDFVDKLKALQEAMCVTVFGFGSRFQKAILLHGAPKSGKTQLLRVIQCLVPAEARCAVSPDEWGDKFMPAVMHTKILNVCGELSDKRRIDGQLFKDIIDGSDRPAQFKNKQIFMLRPELAHWFASNHLPKTDDTSSGFIRRWLFLTFHYPIKDEETELDIGDLIAAEEREAIVAWACESLPRLLERNRFTEPTSHKNLCKEFANINNSVRLFLVESGKVKFGVEQGFTTEAKAFNAYWAFCAGAGGARPVSMPKFRMMMRELQSELDFSVKITQTITGGSECLFDRMVVL